MAKKVSEDETAGAAEPIAADQAGADSDPLVDKLIEAGAAASAGQLGEINDYLKAEQDKFRAAYPKLSAAIDAWQASGKPAPTAVRIISKIDGFRRAGIAHPKNGVVHPIETTFKEPDQLEALFAEPNLLVEFV